MDLKLKLFLFTLLSAWGSGSMATVGYSGRRLSLAARLHADDESLMCWESMIELQACIGEVIFFFLDNGEVELGSGCCQAIETIQRHCWPAMLTSLGFTPEEGDILQGYCDTTVPSVPPPLASLGGTVLDPR